MVWQQGRAVVDYLVHHNRLEIIPVHLPAAQMLLADAQSHARRVEELAHIDSALALRTADLAVHRAWTALLYIQGLQPTTPDDHAVVTAALYAQLHPPLGRLLKRSSWMRRVGATPQGGSVSNAQLHHATRILEEVLQATQRLLPILPPYHASPNDTPSDHPHVGMESERDNPADQDEMLVAEPCPGPDGLAGPDPGQS